MRVLASVVALFALAAPAWADDGGGRTGLAGSAPPGLREPTGPVTTPPPPLNCFGCAEIGCDRCTEASVRSGENLAVRNQIAVVLERQGDFARVRVTLEFRAKTWMTEAIAEISTWPVLAITTARVEHGTVRLDARVRDSGAAGRAYLSQITAAKRLLAGAPDPLLLTRKGPGRFDVRVFPVTAESLTVVTVEGWAVVDAPPPTRPWVHRSGDHVVVVTERPAGAIDAFGEWYDPSSSRTIVALTRAETKRRFPGLLTSGSKTSFALPIANALRVSEERWVALERGVDKLPSASDRWPFDPRPLSPPPP